MTLLRWLLSGEGRLKERVVRGGVWLLLGDGAAQAAGLVKLAILGRLLSPHDFGLMGIAMLVVKWLEYFTETGFNAALIQKPGDIRPYLDTAWTVQILRRFGLALILFVGAPLGAWFFENVGATPIIRAIAFVTLLRGFTNPAVVYLRKELDFRREVMWRLAAPGAGLVVAVVVALAYRSVWALVLAVIAAQATETLSSYWIQPYRPRVQLERAKALELMQFGKWIFWFNVVVFFGLYLDSLAVGRLLGASALGFYQMAHQFASLPTVQIGTHVRGVMFPAFAKLGGERHLRHAFLRTLALVFSVVAPIGCFLTLFAGPLVLFVLGPRWVTIVPPIQILAWAGVASALTGVTSSLLMAVGRPKLAVGASLLKVVAMAGLLYPLTNALGIAGAALAVTTSAFVAMAYQLFMVGRLVERRWSEILGALKIGALGSAPFLAAGLLVSHAPSPSLFLVAGLAIGTYLTILVAALRFHFEVRPALWGSRQP